MWKEKGPCHDTQGERMAEAEFPDVLHLFPEVVQVPDASVLLLRATYGHKQLLQRLLSHGGQLTCTVKELRKKKTGGRRT